MFLEGKYKDVSLAGYPDAVCFDGRSVACILDYKITESNQLQMSHRVQLLLYAYLLQEKRINVDNLILICVLIHPRHCSYFEGLSEFEKKDFVISIRLKSEKLVSTQPFRLNWYCSNYIIQKKINVKLRIFKYDRERAKRELDFSLDYWLGKRRAMPTKNYRKCERCLYNASNLCSVPKAIHE